VDAGFPKRSCSTKDLERDVDSTSNDPALGAPDTPYLPIGPVDRARNNLNTRRAPKNQSPQLVPKSQPSRASDSGAIPGPKEKRFHGRTVSAACF
jgi:hypothetical protein